MKTLIFRFSLWAFVGSSGLVWSHAKAQDTTGSCSETDLDFICQNTELVQGIATSCGDDCLSEGQECMEACMAEQLELTSSCIGCFGNQVSCIVDNCLFACAFLGEEACAQCAVENCEAGFNECAGIVDNDNDEWTNLCDCDDSNPNIYPQAPGTNDGYDNDCNGLYTADELAGCTADLNNDGLVGTNDLLLFLQDFNCSNLSCEDSPADLNGDGTIGASDLLQFLSEFGIYCL
ncbi:MAG: GC-type dockerin domain-anchored protein [Flavobacteriales bacterium]